MANKRIKENRYKPAPASNEGPRLSAPRKKTLFRQGTILLVMLLFSLLAIYLHDGVVQSPFFTIQTVEISGIDRVSRDEVETLAGLDKERNLFEVRPDLMEKKITTHPWVARAKVSRKLFTTLTIQVEEEDPLAIVAIENLADIIINTQGVPFKEYDPEKDGLTTLPVITGVDLSLSGTTYIFEGDLFNSVMDLLKVRGLGQVRSIHGDNQTGLMIQAPDIYNTAPITPSDASDGSLGSNRILIPVKLGFHQFEKKLARAKKISRYMADRFPGKTILAMDLYNIEKIFIKTEDTLHNTLEKGA